MQSKQALQCACRRRITCLWWALRRAIYTSAHKPTTLNTCRPTKVTPSYQTRPYNTRLLKTHSSLVCPVTEGKNALFCCALQPCCSEALPVELQGAVSFCVHLTSVPGQAYSALTELGQHAGHDMTVYAVKWNNIHTRIFLSASADWTLKLWEGDNPRPVMSFDLNNPVGDAAWSPHSATVFAAVTDDGKVCCAYHLWSELSQRQISALFCMCAVLMQTLLVTRQLCNSIEQQHVL